MAFFIGDVGIGANAGFRGDACPPKLQRRRIAERVVTKLGIMSLKFN